MSVMLGEAFANAAMLDRPLPFASCPLTLAALNVMFSTVTAALTLLNWSGMVPEGGCTTAICGADAVYTHDEQLNPPYTVTAAALEENVTAFAYVPAHT